VIDTQVKVERNGSPVRALISWPSGLGDQEEAAQLRGQQVCLVDGRQARLGGRGQVDVLVGVTGTQTFEQPYDYAAAIDLYFAAAFLPSDPSRATV
jgi:YidC/Oxa1 family membrane protein insertase